MSSLDFRVAAPYLSAMSEAADLYERDFYAWTQDQAARLRAWPEQLRPNGVDLEHLAEEVEDLGKSERRAIESLLLQLVLHLLKLRAHPDQSARRQWQREVDAFRDQLAVLFRESPSLHARRAELAAGVWSRAARLYRRDLERDGLRLAAPLSDSPDLDLDREILAEDWFPPQPAG